MKSILPFLAIVALFVSILASCGSTKHTTRKCDGRKGTRTPMGLM